MSTVAIMKTTVTVILLLGTFATSQTAEVKDALVSAPFSCVGRSAGYYADMESGCQKYHMCDVSGRIYSYSCPNQTLFQQRVMICDHFFMVDCALSETHFGANLLIGQKDRHFVEHFQQASGHNQERGRSYPTNSRAYYADPSKDSKIQSQRSNEIKQALSAKNLSSQSITKKLTDDKESLTRTPVANKYNAPFSTPSTGSIKPTNDKSLPRELANNPFFRGLTVAPTLIADKGEHDLLTFLSPHQRKDHAESTGRNVFPVAREGGSHSGVSTSRPSWTTTSRPSWTTPPPSHAPRGTGTFSTPPSREYTHSTSRSPWTTAPSFAQRGTGTFSIPPSREAVPALRNTPSFPNYQERRTSTLVTTEVPLTYDSKFVTPQGHSNLLQTETPKLQNSFAKVITNDENLSSESTLTTQYEFLKTRERTNAHTSTTSSRAPHDFSVTPSPQGGKGVTFNSPRDREPLPTTLGEGGSARLNVTYGNTGGLQITPGGFKFTAHNTTRGSEVSGVPSPPSATQFSNGHPSSDRAGSPNSFDATRGFDGGRVPSSPGVTQFSNGHPSSDRAGSPTSFDATRGFDGGRVPSSPGATQFTNGHPSSDRAGSPTSFDATRRFNTASSDRAGTPSTVNVTPSERVLTGPNTSLGFDKGSVLTGPDTASLLNLPSADAEDEVDYNTVEVRIPDTRRMFFIPDSAAREAEMLNSNNETVLTISLPSERHHGAMRFKGARGAEGRRADCPQCHPAFLLPGQCHPCVLIRR